MMNGRRGGAKVFLGRSFLTSNKGRFSTSPTTRSEFILWNCSLVSRIQWYWILTIRTWVFGNGWVSSFFQSKGTVLSKAVDYITELHQQLAQARSVKDSSQKMHLLAIENEVYKKQADVLMSYIREKGLEFPSNMPIAALNALQELQQGTAILIAQQTRVPGK